MFTYCMSYTYLCVSYTFLYPKWLNINIIWTIVIVYFSNFCSKECNSNPYIKKISGVQFELKFRYQFWKLGHLLVNIKNAVSLFQTKNLLPELLCFPVVCLMPVPVFPIHSCMYSKWLNINIIWTIVIVYFCSFYSKECNGNVHTAIHKKKLHVYNSISMSGIKFENLGIYRLI